MKAYSRPRAELLPAAVPHVVEAAGAAAGIDEAHLQVVLQVLADAGQLVAHRHAGRLQHGSRADARQLQDVRRADGAGGQDDLARGA